MQSVSDAEQSTFKASLAAVFVIGKAVASSLYLHRSAVSQNYFRIKVQNERSASWLPCLLFNEQ